MERYCKYCGVLLNPDQAICTNCGTLNQLPQPVEQAHVSEVPLPSSQPIPSSPPQTQAPSPPHYPMKWFHFIIYFQLFASCIVHFTDGLSAINGYHYYEYDITPELIYSAYPSIKTADTIYGILLIALAVFALIIRFRLSGFHSDGPTLYLLFIVGQVVVSLIYILLFTNAARSVPFLDTSGAWSIFFRNLVVAVIIFSCNAIYFDKRRMLFAGSSQKYEKQMQKDYLKQIKGLPTEAQAGIDRQALLSSDDPQTVQEANEIRRKVHAYISKSSSTSEEAAALKNAVLINEYKPQSDSVGCFRDSEGWMLYYVEDNLIITVKGPFSKDGIISALTKTLGISTGIAPLNFTSDEADIFLGKSTPLIRYVHDLQKKK